MIQIELIECDDKIDIHFHYTFNQLHNFDVNRVYNNQTRLEILKRRDVDEYSRTPFVEKNRVYWETFINDNLDKRKLKLITVDVKVCVDDPIEDLISIWTENAAKITKLFFMLRGHTECICCHQTKPLTRAHLLHDRPELLKHAILEAPIIDDGCECHISSKWVMRKYIELHKKFPIAPLCKECHKHIDTKGSS